MSSLEIPAFDEQQITDDAGRKTWEALDAIRRVLTALALRVQRTSSMYVGTASLTTPAILNDGNVWIEAAGISPARVATLYIRDNGVSVVIVATAPY